MEDIKLVQAIAKAVSNDATEWHGGTPVMVIVDARPWQNAMAQKTIMQAGFETTTLYELPLDQSNPFSMFWSDNASKDNGESSNSSSESSTSGSPLAASSPSAASDAGHFSPHADRMRSLENSRGSQSMPSTPMGGGSERGKTSTSEIEGGGSFLPGITSSPPPASEVHEAGKAIIRCRIVFMGIENIHAMRKSWNKLSSLCQTSISDDSDWLSNLQATLWFEHTSTILEGACQIAQLLDEEQASVLVHCSDGWDRTAQLTGLAMLMLDSYYRTIEGFEVLVEKEWVSFGYRFNSRCAHETNPDDQEVSPVFVQWIDCVWQLLHQFPTHFEFNEVFLLTVVYHLHSGRFGTFLHNSEAERKKAGAFTRSKSLWFFMNDPKNRKQYTNPFYTSNMQRAFEEGSDDLWRRIQEKQHERAGHVSRPATPHPQSQRSFRTGVSKTEGHGSGSGSEPNSPGLVRSRTGSASSSGAQMSTNPSCNSFDTIDEGYTSGERSGRSQQLKDMAPPQVSTSFFDEVASVLSMGSSSPAQSEQYTPRSACTAKSSPMSNLAADSRDEEREAEGTLDNEGVGSSGESPTNNELVATDGEEEDTVSAVLRQSMVGLEEEVDEFSMKMSRKMSKIAEDPLAAMGAMIGSHDNDRYTGTLPLVLFPRKEQFGAGQKAILRVELQEDQLIEEYFHFTMGEETDDDLDDLDAISGHSPFMNVRHMVRDQTPGTNRHTPLVPPSSFTTSDGIAKSGESPHGPSPLSRDRALGVRVRHPDGDQSNVADTKVDEEDSFSAAVSNFLWGSEEAEKQPEEKNTSKQLSPEKRRTTLPMTTLPGGLGRTSKANKLGAAARLCSIAVSETTRMQPLRKYADDERHHYSNRSKSVVVGQVQPNSRD
jgi:hypothetical protein